MRFYMHPIYTVILLFLLLLLLILTMTHSHEPSLLNIYRYVLKHIYIREINLFYFNKIQSWMYFVLYVNKTFIEVI